MERQPDLFAQVEEPAAPSYSEGTAGDPFGDSSAALASDRPAGKGDKVATVTIEEHLNGSKPQNVSHAGRSRTHYERRGYIYGLAEFTETKRAGDMVVSGRKHDLFGIFDAVALPKLVNGQPLVKGPAVGVQVVSTDDKNAHLRKMGSEEVDSRSQAKRIDSLLAWMAAGNLVEILEWRWDPTIKGNQKWWPTVHQITEQDVRAMLARRRKK